MPVFLTEYGYETNPPDVIRGVTLKPAARDAVALAEDVEAGLQLCLYRRRVLEQCRRLESLLQGS